MAGSKSGATKRKVQFPGSYSDTDVLDRGILDTEALGLSVWDRSADDDLDDGDFGKPSPFLRPQNHSVLLVDDDVDQLKFLKRIIEKAGFRVVASQSAAEALDLLSDRPVDIVVSDYKMPEMNGFEFLQAIRARDIEGVYGDVPVIMLTACGDDLEFVALERGADMFCEKFRAESLLVKQINFLLDG
jgi:CheY-like chemotaxis protein